MPLPNLPTLAAITYARGFDIDRQLVDVCADLARDGLKLGGLLQVSTGERGGSCATSVHVVDLRTGEPFDIWEDRGPCAKGCRLDEGGLALAEPVIARAISDRVDLLIINRFGRAESLGRGLRRCFESALEAGIPVLTSVREPYDTAWREFHGGLGVELGCEREAVRGWFWWNLNGSTRELQPLPE
jgi:nucleoside-triphosphatase THEP1